MASGAESGGGVLRHRDFRLFLTSRFLWGVALQMQAIAIAWRVYEVTRDPLALGLIGLFAFAPALREPVALLKGLPESAVAVVLASPPARTILAEAAASG